MRYALARGIPSQGRIFYWGIGDADYFIIFSERVVPSV